MKNFLFIFVNLGIIAFLLAGIFAFVNYFFGTNISFKGAEIPGDPVIGLLSFVLSGIFYGVSFLFREKKNPTND